VLRRRGLLLLLGLSPIIPVLAFVIYTHDETASWRATIWQFAVMLVACAAVNLTVFLWVLPRIQWKYDKEIRQRARTDLREYVLVLRSFESQILRIKGQTEPGNLMLEVCDAIPRDLAVVCIGRGDTIRGLMQLGAFVPLRPPNPQWEEVFKYLATCSRAIIVTPEATNGCIREMRMIVPSPILLAKTLVWMPHAHQKTVKPAWNQTRSRLHGFLSLPEYDAGGMLYRPNPDFSPRVTWPTQKRKVRETLGEAIAEIPRSKYNLRVALDVLDQKKLGW
jgi:hypothetical protein